MSRQMKGLVFILLALWALLPATACADTPAAPQTPTQQPATTPEEDTTRAQPAPQTNTPAPAAQPVKAAPAAEPKPAENPAPDKAPLSPAPAHTPAPRSEPATQAPTVTPPPAATAPTPLAPRLRPGEPIQVYVVPIKGEISSPQLYILRRSLKTAISEGVHAVVLDMDTPGGGLGVTLEMMEALGNFKGETITYVNDEAISAGSYIAIATNHIYFAPKGVMGAAEAVQAGGQEVNESMKRKINSYLRAKVRTMAGESRYRADVQRAMMDDAFVLEIDGKTLKRQGELLSLTADEAIQTYGNPPQPLLAAGVAPSVEDVLNARFGKGNYVVRDFQLTWSEHFAKWLSHISPVLMGLGLLLLIIDIKTGHFGPLAITGLSLLLIVFAGNYVAGLAGYEVVIIFLLGAALILAEILLFPGTAIVGVLGAMLMLGALVFSMTDIWPKDGGGFTFAPNAFLMPVLDLMLGLLVAVMAAFLFARFLPKGWLWDRLILRKAVETPPAPVASSVQTSVAETPHAPSPAASARPALPAAGTAGTAATDLFPTGEVEIAGKRYYGRARLGTISRGTRVVVVGQDDFALIVTETTTWNP